MSNSLNGKTIAFLVAPEGVEQVELTEPWKAVEEAGGTPELVSTEVGKIQAFNHLTPADTFEADKAADSVSASDYAALVLPGGVANPDNLRMNDGAVAFVKSFFDAGKPVAVICHGPWTLIEAGVVNGRTLTSWPSLRTDLRNAGATWVDEEVHVDEGLVSSRNPGDLPAFCAKLLEEFAEGEHEGQRPRARSTA
jgi:protease I